MSEDDKPRLVDQLIAAALGGAFPVVGDVAGVLYLHVMESRYSRRLAAWRHEITEVVNDLARRYNNLAEDELFLDAFIAASRIALSTHQREKIDALRNALVNSVGPDAPGADEQARFFQMVDEFTAGHLLLLGRFDQNPGTDSQVNERQRVNASGSWGHALDAVVPEFAGRGDIRDLLIADLVRHHLIDGPPQDRQHVLSLNDEYFFGHTTELGKRFLRFITQRD
jgi:hypothetical protein